jgi:AcrR family transcriptional regulator
MGLRKARKRKTVDGEGLRERKRRLTRERISEAALTLFLERGFEATTVDDISAAAEVSKRSFFDYFPTKEDVVQAWQDEFGFRLATAIADRPADEPMTKVVEEALITSLKDATADPRNIAIGDLIHETPALRARDQLKYAKLEQILAEALTERVKGQAERLRARLLAMIAVGGLRVGGEAWRKRPQSESVEIFARRIFGTIWDQLADFGVSAKKR